MGLLTDKLGPERITNIIILIFKLWVPVVKLHLYHKTKFTGINSLKLKGQSNEIFEPPFHNSKLTGPLTNRLKYFRFWLKVIQIFLFSPQYYTTDSQSHLSIIMPRVNLPAVSYYAESISFSIILRGVMGLFSTGILFKGTFQHDF